MSKSALKGDTKPKQETDEAFYNSQKYEVLYCGKVSETLRCGVLKLLRVRFDRFGKERVREQEKNRREHDFGNKQPQ